MTDYLSRLRKHGREEENESIKVVADIHSTERLLRRKRHVTATSGFLPSVRHHGYQNIVGIVMILSFFERESSLPSIVLRS